MQSLSTFAKLWPLRSLGTRPRVILTLAFVASVLLHLAITQWDVRFSDPIEDLPPLSATITGLPPPPAPVAAARPTLKPRRQTRPATATAPEVVAQAEPAVETSAPAAPPAEMPVAAAPALDEPVVSATEIQPLPKQLPPRIDLAYRAFLGTRGFFVGDAVYRLEHTANQYKISTVGEARGLAALLFRGQGKATSYTKVSDTQIPS